MKTFGDYDKIVYVVTLKSGEQVRCWPNAGLMHSLVGGKVFEPQEVESIIGVPDE